MKEIMISPNEAGQRLDKFLHKYLTQAGSGFLYKMLRKKNITLNDKKATGNEKLVSGDKVILYLAQDTLDKFQSADTAKTLEEYQLAYNALGSSFSVLYEDTHILLLNKKSGILTQKATETDYSLNEAMIGYLLATEAITPKELETFKPSVCNRLDRNTSGIVICGKSLLGSQKMSELLKERSLHKYYNCIVTGSVTQEQHLKAYLKKDEAVNTVEVFSEPVPGSSLIETWYHPIPTAGDISLKQNQVSVLKKSFHTEKSLHTEKHFIQDKISILEIELITGKTHQIRAHLSFMGHPILGDSKYGRKAVNEKLKREFGVTCQLLHCCRIEFPVMEEPFQAISQKIIKAKLPPIYQTIMTASNNEASQYKGGVF